MKKQVEREREREEAALGYAPHARASGCSAAPQAACAAGLKPGNKRLPLFYVGSRLTAGNQVNYKVWCVVQKHV
jgi:hypothetical protein